MYRTVLSLIFVMLATCGFSQMTLQQKLQSGMDIDSQFTAVLQQSRSQDADFKIIRKSNLAIIQKNIRDSLNAYKKSLNTLKSSTSNATGTIAGLKDSLSTVQSALIAEHKKTDSIAFLGMDFAKGSYHALVWILIAVLAVGFVTMLFSYRKAKVDTVAHRESAELAQSELQQFKKKAMEKEQQLKRQLLDEQLKRNS